MNRFFMGVLVLIALPAFAFEYDGDGDFTDRGVLSAFDRYRLVLPHVNLCKKGDYSFSIGELPAEALFIAIEYIYPKEFSKEDAFQLKKQMQSGLDIMLVIEDLDNKSVVYAYNGKLYESGHDATGNPFSRGFPGVVEDLYGKIVFRIDDVDLHKGFFWQHHSAKKLNFVVVTPTPSLPNCTANFVIHGGGWQ